MRSAKLQRASLRSNNRFNGHRTASAERYNKNAFTASHQTLPFGTKVKVTRVKNRKSVVVRINDRGPTQAGRIVDLSRHAAQSLGMHKSLAEVKLEVVAVAGAKKHKTKHKSN